MVWRNYSLEKSNKIIGNHETIENMKPEKIVSGGTRLSNIRQFYQCGPWQFKDDGFEKKPGLKTSLGAQFSVERRRHRWLVQKKWRVVSWVDDFVNDDKNSDEEIELSRRSVCLVLVGKQSAARKRKNTMIADIQYTVNRLAEPTCQK